jgi:exocyst complex component 3
MPPDRPKKLREKCFNEIRKLINNRVQGCRFSEPEENKSWLAHHLVHIKDILIKDLEIVKKLCEPCFPPHYKIFDFFINTIQSVLSAHVIFRNTLTKF